MGRKVKRRIVSIGFTEQSNKHAQTPAAVQTQYQPHTSEPVSASRLVAQAQLDGKGDASNYSSGKYRVGGLVGGFLGGIIGAGIAYGVTSGRDVDVPLEKNIILVDQPAEYQMGYRESYEQGVKSKRKSASLTGGLIGTAAVVALILSAGN